MSAFLKKDEVVFIKIDKDGRTEIVPERDLHYSYQSVKEGRAKIFRVTGMEELELNFDFEPKKP